MIETGIGKTKISITLKLDLKTSLDMSVHTAWMLLRWLCILFGLQAHLKK
jgi:hypothetical protein